MDLVICMNDVTARDTDSKVGMVDFDAAKT